MDNGKINYNRYLEGDDEGLTELIRGYKDGLILYLSSILGNVGAAEELMEDVFFRLAVKKPRFTGKSSFKTWLYAIGRNAAVDVLRKRSRRSTVPVDELKDLADEECLERSYLINEQKITLHRAMKNLSADYRQVLCLTYFEGYSNSEAAQIMHKNNRQIENLLYRAKKALKTQLEKEGFEYERL